jgi:Raf kinase inhibitor-like YbhB/YbcL family protein
VRFPQPCPPSGRSDQLGRRPVSWITARLLRSLLLGFRLLARQLSGKPLALVLVDRDPSAMISRFRRRYRAQAVRWMTEKTVLAAALAFCVCAVLGCGNGIGIHLRSPAFKDGGVIPSRYTCLGKGESPPLDWSHVPESEGLLLLVGDADAPPTHPFANWTVYYIPTSVRGLAAGTVPADVEQGRNSYGTVGYGPPCPPRGATHRYVFTLYAVGAKPQLLNHAPLSAVNYEIEIEQVGSGTLTGIVRRP